MDKERLREICLARQKSLSEDARRRLSQKIAENFFAGFDLAQIRFLHCFLPIRKFNEIDTRIILTRLRKSFPQVENFVPRVNFESGEIENARFTETAKLVENQWNIQEPSGEDLIESAEIDLVLVPLLCFDEQGFRVGYGKGFYDRFLKNCRAGCLKIGLSYFPPVEKIRDAQTFDVRLDYCVTPEKIFDFS